MKPYVDSRGPKFARSLKRVADMIDRRCKCIAKRGACLMAVIKNGPAGSRAVRPVACYPVAMERYWRSGGTAQHDEKCGREFGRRRFR